MAHIGFAWRTSWRISRSILSPDVGNQSGSGRHPYQLRLALAVLAYNHNTWAGVGERLNDLRGRDWEQQAESLVGASLDDLAAHAPGAVELLQAMLVFRGGASYEALRAVAAGRLVKPTLKQLFRHVVRTRNLRRAILEHRSLASMTLHVDASDEVFHGHLAAAVDSNLLEEGRQARYDLHPLTRAYLETRRPPEPPHLLAYRGRHAAYFLGYVYQYRQDFDALETELPNLRAGFEFVVAMATRDDAAVYYYVEPMDKFLDRRSYWVEDLRWLNEAVSALQAMGDEKNLAGTYNCIGLACRNQGEYEKALEWYGKSVEIAARLGPMAEYDLSAAYCNIAGVHFARGDYAAALTWLKKGLAIDEKYSRPADPGFAYNNIGMVYQAQGNYDEALTWMSKAEPLLKEAEDWADLASLYNNIGEVYRARGAYDLAMGYYERAAPVLEEIGDRAMLAGVLNNIGRVYHARGAYDQALGYYERAAPVLEEIGDRASLATVQSNLGLLYLRLSDEAAAEAHWRHSVALFDELGLDTEVAQATRVALATGLNEGWDAARDLIT